MYELAPVEQKLMHDSTVMPVALAYEADESERSSTLSLPDNMMNDLDRRIGLLTSNTRTMSNLLGGHDDGCERVWKAK